MTVSGKPSLSPIGYDWLAIKFLAVCNQAARLG